MKLKKIASILVLVYIFSFSVFNLSPLPHNKGYAQSDTSNMVDNTSLTSDTSVRVFVHAKDSMCSDNMTKDNNFLYVGSDGGTIIIPNVKLGYGSIPNDIFSIVASIDKNAKGGYIEVRKDKEDGELLGTIGISMIKDPYSYEQLISFHELNTSLSSTDIMNCNLYIIFKGDCSGRYDSFKITGIGADELSESKSVNLIPLIALSNYSTINRDEFVIRGGPGRILFKLEDAEGNPVVGQKIFLEKYMSAWEIERYSTTDSSGIANFNYTPNSYNWTRGDTIKASFFGNDQYKASFNETFAFIDPPYTPTPRHSYIPSSTPTTTPTFTPTSTPTSTPTPTSDISIIDNSSQQCSYDGNWQEQSGGTDGSYKLNTQIGSTAKWKFKVPEDGYYEIEALLPDGLEYALSKYTVFYNDKYIDSFYNNSTKGNFKLTKFYGNSMLYKKDSWITVIVRSVSEGKCIADAISFKKLSYMPTPYPTAAAGFSKPILVQAEDCILNGVVKEDKFISSYNDGDYFTIKDVLLSGFNGHDRINIFSVNLAVSGNSTGNNKLELRLDAPDGPILGTFDIKNTQDGLVKFNEQAYILNNINTEFTSKDVYVLFRGQGECSIDWVKFSNTSKSEPGQSESLDIYSKEKRICGYIKPGFETTNISLYAGFKVTADGTDLFSYTDTNGYFELSFSDITINSLKISNKGYLERNIIISDNATYVSSKKNPIEMCPGDTNQDNIINMADVISIAAAFNSIKGSITYRSESDINRDDVINMVDTVIVAEFFGKTI